MHSTNKCIYRCIPQCIYPTNAFNDGFEMHSCTMQLPQMHFQMHLEFQMHLMMHSRISYIKLHSGQLEMNFKWIQKEYAFKNAFGAV